MSVNEAELARGFAIYADEVVNFDSREAEELGVHLVPSAVFLDGERCMDTDWDLYYRKIEKANMIKTSCPSPQEITNELEKALARGLDILYITMAEGVSSGTAHSIRLAINMLAEKYPERKLVAIDSACMAGGMELLVRDALAHEETLEGLVAFLKCERSHVAHVFTMSDLSHAGKSGKISALKLFLATKLKVQPLLEMVPRDTTRILQATRKIRGGIVLDSEGVLVRDVVAQTIIDYTVEKVYASDALIFVTYGRAGGIAEQRADWIMTGLAQKLPKARLVKKQICPTVGVHVGPTVVSVHFFKHESDFS